MATVDSGVRSWEAEGHSAEHPHRQWGVTTPVRSQSNVLQEGPPDTYRAARASTVTPGAE